MHDQFRQLPESHTPQVLFDRLARSSSSITKLLEQDAGLLLDVAALAAWSPLLATTLEQNPDYITWLHRERLSVRVHTREDMAESLARFALTRSQRDPHDLVAQFRRREFLRIYLHDIRRAHTIAETTEELSNLADVILEYALKLARQRLDNRYGAPQRIDSDGRIAGTEFCIIAMGKLGSRELNYASDIDLMFLFSHEGVTSTGGSREPVTNREYFVKLAENILRLVSEPTGEGAAYRADVRLRPHGREGTLACGLDEAVRYYQTRAQDWELQTLIRARAAAGSVALYDRFAAAVSDRIYRCDVSVAAALSSVRLAKEKIDCQHERGQKGFNVKLGRGGIREIEFIAQALQIAFGGRDQWLRAPHTLISLARLAERGLITETEYSQLSYAYQFWRRLEHRLQMEHGLQTHSVPMDRPRRELVARRMNFSGEDPLAGFDAAIARHATNVRGVFDRVFAEADLGGRKDRRPARQAGGIQNSTDPDGAAALRAASIIVDYLVAEDREHFSSSPDGVTRLAHLLRTTAEASLNCRRGLSFAVRFARSLDKETQSCAITLSDIEALIELCSVSEPLGEMVAGRPVLIHALKRHGDLSRRDYSSKLRAAVSNHENFPAELDALRLGWSEALVEIGAADAAARLTLSDVNRSLTALAVGSLEAALQIAQNELERRLGKFVAEPRLAILGLGRLGSGGMDYGSDLDIIVIYDSQSPSPVAELTRDEIYARMVELMIAALSNLTRTGSLYRVDLRLRPDGQKGPIVSSSEGFLSYLRQRAGIWEWLAYVKLRAVAGKQSFGGRVESTARQCIHDLAQRTSPSVLLGEARRVRTRLEKEKASRNRGLNIKHGPQGMLDVYFAVRYLQLRDNVPDCMEDQTTLKMLERLRATGSINQEHFQAMRDGYRMLRSVDHQMRLIVGRSTTLPLATDAAFYDMARRLGYGTAAALAAELQSQMAGIRAAYDQIMRPKPD